MQISSDILFHHIIPKVCDCGSNFKALNLVSKQVLNFVRSLHPTASTKFANPIKSLCKKFGDVTCESRWLEWDKTRNLITDVNKGYFISNFNNFIVLCHDFPKEHIVNIVKRECRIVEGLYDFDFYWNVVCEMNLCESDSSINSVGRFLYEIVTCNRFNIQNTGRTSEIRKILDETCMSSFLSNVILDGTLPPVTIDNFDRIQRSRLLTMDYINSYPSLVWDPMIFSFNNITIGDIFDVENDKWLIPTCCSTPKYYFKVLREYCMKSHIAPCFMYFYHLDNERYVRKCIIKLFVNEHIEFDIINEYMKMYNCNINLALFASHNRSDIPLELLLESQEKVDVVVKLGAVYMYGKYTWEEITKSEWKKHYKSIAMNKFRM